MITFRQKVLRERSAELTGEVSVHSKSQKAYGYHPMPALTEINEAHRLLIEYVNALTAQVIYLEARIKELEGE